MDVCNALRKVTQFSQNYPYRKLNNNLRAEDRGLEKLHVKGSDSSRTLRVSINLRIDR